MPRIEVLSEVTGKVWKLQSAVGEAVTTDDPLLVVESMKMEIPVFSEKAGRVLELRVAEGDAVEEGQVVAVVEA
ncbi:biotin/lipoyl-binding carrier protein [uncultured Xylophilus sp.]|uniref:biotin/lipoyl-binding carrier protein n=1 Tax=uncultured Xylophilus sp. TaxID=296832 RepID=UPI0025E8B7A7|nr:biotin/lipoyl-binding carrier protein [uncultured Xylophilus sp.]